MAIPESRRGSGSSEAHVMDEFEDESEVRGNLFFAAPVEVLPCTQRTADLLARKAAERQRRREEAEELRRRKEEEEAQRRLREQEAKKMKLLMKQRQKEEEQRKREEEEQRKQLEGGLDRILAQLNRNMGTVQAVNFAGIELESVRFRLLCNALSANTSCRTITLARKNLCDEDGVSFAAMLGVNRTLEHVDLEGNGLGLNTARKLGEVVADNTSLKYLSLRDNDLTASGRDQNGVAELARGLARNNCLMVLLLGRNGISSAGGEHLLEYLRCRRARLNSPPPYPVILDVTENSLSTEQMREVQKYVDENAAELHSRRVVERQERIEMQKYDDETHDWLDGIEKERITICGIESRRSERVRGYYEDWKAEVENLALQDMRIEDELMQEAEERKAAKKGKKKGKKK